MDATPIYIEDDFVTLTALLKIVGIVGTGGEAKQLIQAGAVEVDGSVESRRGAKIRPGSTVEVDATPPIVLAIHRESGGESPAS